VNKVEITYFGENTSVSDHNAFKIVALGHLVLRLVGAVGAIGTI